MSSGQRLLSVLPKGIRSLRIEIESYNGNRYDVSGNYTELSIYESIYTPFLSGELILVDNSSMLSKFPFIGQEKLLVQWERDDELFEKRFFITGVFDVARALDGVGAYGLTLSSEKQMLNASSLFSKAYRGRSDEIIRSVYEEYLGSDLVIGTNGKTSHNVVFPFIKPLQAIDMMCRNTLAEDNTPMFMYESLYREETRLESFGSMYSADPIIDLEMKLESNNDPSKPEPTRDLSDGKGRVYEFSLPKSYETLERLGRGDYASQVTVSDPSTRRAEISDFDYRRHAPSLANDSVSEYFAIGGQRVNNRFDTRNVTIPLNRYAFNDEFPNLNTVEDLDRNIIRSYQSRHSTSTVKLYMDSIAYTLDNAEPFGVGKTVNFNMSRFSPKLQYTEDKDDYVNSGKYLVCAVRHYIKNGEYTMAAEIVRDGIGEDANLTPDGREPDYTEPVRVRSQIFPEF